MSYQQYPPYGQAPPQQGYGQYPPPQQGQPPQGYYPPAGQYPQNQYGQQQPPPPPPGQYGQQYPPPQQGQYPPPQGQYPPPQQQGYSGYQQQPPPHGQYPGYQQPPPQGQYPPPQHTGYGVSSPQPSPYGQQGGYQQPPPPQGYGYPQQQQQQQQPPYGAPSPLAAGPRGAPLPPSPGYGPPPPQIRDFKPDPDVKALRSAMKGFGTDEKTLIRVLVRLKPWESALVRQRYMEKERRDLVKDIKSETSSWFEKGLVALAQGPLLHDVSLLHDAMDGVGTKEDVLNDVLLGRSNADLQAIKNEYSRVYGHSLESKVRGDLSMKTERHFLMVLAANRTEGVAPVPQDIDRDVMEIYKATEGKVGTDELIVCDILTHRNDDQIRTIAWQYKERYNLTLESVIKKEFSGHMEDALLFQLRHACDPHMHKAMLLEDAMSGVGTKDHLLISRLVRFHWNSEEVRQLKGAYQQWRGQSLAKRIKGETSGDYEKLCLALIGE